MDDNNWYGFLMVAAKADRSSGKTILRIMSIGMVDETIIRLTCSRGVI
jgi:hypothetical protein